MNRSSILAAISAGLATLFVAAPALAVPGYSTAHLNLRTGPGTQYPVVGVMEYNTQADITGCLSDWSWCSVNVAGLSGWASAEYLVIDQGGQVMQITGPDSGIPVVEAAGVAEVVAPATVGAVVAANGNVAAIVPEPAVLEYIAATPVNPFAVEGEIVVGAVLPAAVTLYEVPGSTYAYTIVNGLKILVDPNSRAVVYIYRS
ncbi:MAG TPA: DUF1236 domain-containing protein [Bauldia sp.]|nr:DUF1236 domain-containing protein [Bauldia sp.]